MLWTAFYSFENPITKKSFKRSLYNERPEALKNIYSEIIISSK